MIPNRLVVILLAAPVVAGCLAGPASTTDGSGIDDGLPGDASWAKAALPSGDGHTHADPAHHQGLTTPNFEVVGHDPLVSPDYGTTPPGNLCGDVANTTDDRRLAVSESRGDVAFTVVDVTDAANPQRLGELVMRTTYVYDMAVLPDGDHVALVTSQPKQPDQGPMADVGLSWRSPCVGGTTDVRSTVQEWAPQSTSLLLVDIRDPRDPVVVDARPLAGLGHSVYAKHVDDRQVILASTWAATSATSTFQLYEAADRPTGTGLHHLSTYSYAPDSGPDHWQRYMGHNDGWIQTHPETGDTLAYLALWNSGLLLLDISDPTRPELEGQWDGYAGGPDDDSGSTHSAHPIDGLWDGHHYTVIGPEIVGHPSDTPTGVIRVLDTTDPSEPTEVAAWTLPHDVNWNASLQFSPHYLTVQGQTAFVSMYHGGVWALDLSEIEPGSWTRLRSVGVFMPVADDAPTPDDGFRWAPTIEEALDLGDGKLLSFDSNTGAWTYTFDEDRPAPSPEPWDVEKAG